MKCPYCDNEVPYNVTTCPSCGAQVTQQQPPPPVPQQQPYGQQPYGQQPVNGLDPRMLVAKTRSTYIILAILLGEFGVHNFYAGYNSKAWTQLLITILTGGYCCLISWVWAVIEAINVKSDAQGIPFK